MQMDITHQPFQRLNKINASSSEVEISEMNSLAQSPQRGGSSDQQAAGVPITTASEGRRNEEQQQQIVDVNSSHGADDRSSDEAKELYFLKGVIQNGIVVLCSLLATFCLQTILTLPGGIKPEQLQSKAMNNTTVRQRLESFLSSVISCCFLSLASIFSVTIVSSLRSEHSIYLYSIMMGALIAAVTFILKDGLVLATNDSIAHVAFVRGTKMFFQIFASLIILGLLTFKKVWSKIRDLIT